MICNSTMRPFLVLAGTLVIVLGISGLVLSRRGSYSFPAADTEEQFA